MIERVLPHLAGEGLRVLVDVISAAIEGRSVDAVLTEEKRRALRRTIAAAHRARNEWALKNARKL